MATLNKFAALALVLMVGCLVAITVANTAFVLLEMLP